MNQGIQREPNGNNGLFEDTTEEILKELYSSNDGSKNSDEDAVSNEETIDIYVRISMI